MLTQLRMRRLARVSTSGCLLLLLHLTTAARAHADGGVAQATTPPPTPPPPTTTQPTPPTKDQCIESNRTAQSLRRAQKLDEARRELEACTHAACPAIVRDDCKVRLESLERVQPMIAFEVRDAAGAEVKGVTLTIDNQTSPVSVDAMALIRIDPGEHQFVFHIPDAASPFKQTFTILEGEKGRRERIVVPVRKSANNNNNKTVSSGAPESPPRPGESSSSSSPSSGEGGGGGGGGGGFGTQKILGLGAAGVGVAGIAIGAVFGLMASAAWNDQQAHCNSPTACPDHEQALRDHDQVTTNGMISTIGFVAGGVFLVGGAALFFTAKPPTSSANAATLVVGGRF